MIRPGRLSKLETTQQRTSGYAVASSGAGPYLNYECQIDTY